MAAENEDDIYPESFLERRDMLLKELDPLVIRKAWFTLSHLLLDEGARVLDMGCDDGAVTYAMAAMNPKARFTGLDKSKRQITKAREKYQLHNLEFTIGDTSSELFEEESVDAIVNSFVLHEVYSASRYNERIVSDTLRKHFKILKKGGAMFIRDFAAPPPDEFVLLEMPDNQQGGDTLATLSEPDLLIWYAEHARPRQDPGCGGFFLEELPPRFPRTRLFRLPHKWAYEFIIRKDDRTHWETGLPLEYTFFTQRDFMKELATLGARVQYSAPHWEEDIAEKRFEGKFRLFTDDGTPMGHPATSYITIANKMAERKSLSIEERRPSSSEQNKLKITAMRDEKTGRILDVVSREINAAEILPYRVDRDGRLKVWLHDGVARSITNAVQRNGVNLDGRRWSGHMIEPVSVDSKELNEIGRDIKSSVRFCRDHLGLIPREGATLEKGPDYYPSPDYIDERIYTWYLNVEESRNQPVPKNFIGHADRFQAKGVLREMDAQQVLNAITVGLIPNARLELQILSLFNHLNIIAENWTSKNVSFQVGNITKQKSLQKQLKQMQGKEKRFREVKGSSGQLKPVHSTFVEEGQSRGAITGLSAQDIDFVVFDDRTVNTAVVLPMTKNLKEDVHAGFFLEQLPVPQLHQPGSHTMTAPSFNLPRGITHFQQARKFIAEQFSVLPEMVFKMGESYYNHLSLTPQKIHPFGVAVPPDFFELRKMEIIPLWQVMMLRQKWDLNVDNNMLVVAARAYRYLGEAQRLDARLQAKPILRERFDTGKPAWSLPMTYHTPPGFQPPPASRPAPEETLKAEETPVVRLAEPPAPFHAQTQKKEALKISPTIPSGALMEEFERELKEFLEELGSDKDLNPRLEQ